MKRDEALRRKLCQRCELSSLCLPGRQPDLIQAIKWCRQRTGLSLKSAKHHVEREVPCLSIRPRS